ncbi:hypothetical protein KI387_012195, partial [Taxus chinensis]
MAHVCTSLHHLSSFVSPFLVPKRFRTPLDASQIRTLRGGPAPFKATLNVSTRVSHSSPVLIPLEHETEEEEEAAAKDLFSAGEMHIPLDRLFIPPGVDASQLQKGKRMQGSNIVLSPYAKSAQIKQAEFIKSSSTVEECPTNGYPEFALVGRSNVGKSSLVNALVRRKQLAMTSKKPGKTQLINHFLINDSWYLVDLPGYGYAVAPHAVRTDWNEFTKDYFLNRKTLVCVMLLIDASIPAKQIDIDCATWLGQNK